MRRQKKNRSIKYKDIYNLDNTIARFILPRLKFYKKNTIGYPPDLTLKEWKDILDKMILSLELILDTSEPDFGERKYHIEKMDDNLSKLVEDPDSTFDSEAYMKWCKDKESKINEGLKLFAEYFQSLWI